MRPVENSCGQKHLADAYNGRILRVLARTYKCASFERCSADTLDMDADNVIEPHITNEYLNLQEKPGVPPHNLLLVEGALYELMRNFSPGDRLMNHTPVVLRKVHTHHVDFETLDGRFFPYRASASVGRSQTERRR